MCICRWDYWRRVASDLLLLAKGILSDVHMHDRDVDMQFGWNMWTCPLLMFPGYMVRISEDIHMTNSVAVVVLHLP